jgi:RNA polymerase sigma-70 factor (ECF subfamily)
VVRTEPRGADRVEDGGTESGEPLSGEAVKGLWERHRRWVAAIVLAYKPWWVDADDVLQDVALAVVRKGHTVRDAQAFKGWLRMVAINAARLTARTSGPPASAGVDAGASGEVRGGGGAGLAGQSGHAAPADVVIEADRGRAVARLLSRLPEGYREPLVLKAVEGLSYRQIGRILDLPETTVETRIARGRRMLRELAEKEQIR